MSTARGPILAIGGAIIGVLATTLGTPLLQELYSRILRKDTITVSVQVLSAVENLPVKAATVAIVGGASAITDALGTARFTLKADNDPAQISVRKNGYVAITERLILKPRHDAYRIFLNTTSESAVPFEAREVYRSGERASGGGSSFSGWYTLCSSPKPGYTIASAEFMLAGDRGCGGWAECQIVSQSTSAVCWRFRMQGHSEWGGAGQAFSEGILTVIWHHQSE
jgi:hypothetical protein